MRETKIKYKVGTLLNDGGKIGMILAYYPKGAVSFENASKINWRDNYHLYFASHDSYIIGTNAFERLVEQGTIKIIEKGKVED